MPDEFEPDLHDMFVEQACEVFYDAYDAQREHESDPGALSTWTVIGGAERQVAKTAMSALLDWLDSRRL